AMMSDQTIILNRSNALVNEFISRQNELPRTSPEFNLEAILARFLYDQALLSSGLALAGERLVEISRNQAELMLRLVQHCKP
ncbi:MAG: hypothetical protein MI861_28990, partial [Pirellulales bacterium]|nr:hypothetical protein [Pirellulales bacterium]